MRSEGMAKEMPAATLSVLMPMTSPSWVWGDQRAITLRAQEAAALNGKAPCPGPTAALAVHLPEESLAQKLSWRVPLAHIRSGTLYSPTVSSTSALPPRWSVLAPLRSSVH